MIFITIGTAAPFDELFQEVDRLIGIGVFEQDVVCQIGYSVYKPQNCEFFRFSNDLSIYYQQADFLITHGGTGSTIEALISKKPFISFANKRVADSHQKVFLARMEKEYGVIWSEDCSDMKLLYTQAMNKTINHESKVSELVESMLALC